MWKYIIITSAYNEENHVEKAIKSVIKQSILPIEWIIVNDGSSDKTAEIVDEYSSIFPWIKLVNKTHEDFNFGEHAVKLFYYGFNFILKKDFNFIVKLDADLDIDRKDFFEYQLNQMEKNQRLGICSGITYSINNGIKVSNKKRPYWHTGGAMKIYKKKCFEDIGGIIPILGWDGLDEYKAMAKGWKTRTFFNLHVNHLAKRRAKTRESTNWLAYNKGKSLYQRGYPFEFILVKFSYYLIKTKFSLGFSFLKGYFKSIKNKEKLFVNKKEKRFIRKFQYLRIVDKFTKNRIL